VDTAAAGKDVDAGNWKARRDETFNTRSASSYPRLFFVTSQSECSQV
jgi:phage tail tube protein FII